MKNAGLARIFEALSSQTPPGLPDKVAGSSGIVTAAAGLHLTANAWLMCQRLRELGCALPVEIVHGRSEEIPGKVRDGFGPNVDFRVLDDAPPGFAMKPLALWTSRFDRCLWIDADNLPLRDPAFLVSDAGPARFWPDAFRTSSAELLASVNRPLGALEFESGQMVVPTRASARALWFACELNDTYRAALAPYLHGDKDTWRLAWALAGERAEVVPRLPLVVGHECTFVNLRPLPVSLQVRLPGARRLDVGLVQHGPDGPALFLHRTVREFQLFDDHDTLSWTQSIAEQVTRPRLAWSPDAAGPVPGLVSDASAWARDRLRGIDWFPRAFGVPLPARLWLRHRFALEAALAAAVGAARGPVRAGRRRAPRRVVF